MMRQITSDDWFFRQAEREWLEPPEEKDDWEYVPDFDHEEEQEKERKRKGER